MDFKIGSTVPVYRGRIQITRIEGALFGYVAMASGTCVLRNTVRMKPGEGGRITKGALEEAYREGQERLAKG